MFRIGYIFSFSSLLCGFFFFAANNILFVRFIYSPHYTIMLCRCVWMWLYFGIWRFYHRNMFKVFSFSFQISLLLMPKMKVCQCLGFNLRYDVESGWDICHKWSKMMTFPFLLFAFHNLSRLSTRDRIWTICNIHWKFY